MLNVYNGNVTTDAEANAVIALPEYFEALNHELRYQLTVIGQFAQAIVVDEIRGNRFTIKSDKPRVKVSWQVTGVRKDPWAVANRIPVEAEKTGDEKGRYLHPGLWERPGEDAALDARSTIDRARLAEDWRKVEASIERMRPTALKDAATRLRQLARFSLNR